MTLMIRGEVSVGSMWDGGEAKMARWATLGVVEIDLIRRCLSR